MPVDIGQTVEVNFEADIVERIEALVASKKTYNNFAIGRLDTMETSWQEINTALDEETAAEIDLLEDEAEAIDQAKKRLERNICFGLDKKTYGIAGKLVDTDSKTGLPGLEVKVTLVQSEKIINITGDKTDSYGNFCLEVNIQDLKIEERKSAVLRFDIFAAADQIVHTEDFPITPWGGKIDHKKLEVKCTGPLSDSLTYGKLVKESIESDDGLVAARTNNMRTAYKAYSRLTETTLSLIGDLKAEIAVSPPKIVPLIKMAVPVEKEETRYLGNSHTRELHDLENEKRNCRIAQITFDHRLYFDTTEQAVGAGYDYCAYCFGKDKSKR